MKMPQKQTDESSRILEIEEKLKSPIDRDKIAAVLDDGKVRFEHLGDFLLTLRSGLKLPIHIEFEYRQRNTFYATRIMRTLKRYCPEKKDNLTDRDLFDLFYGKNPNVNPGCGDNPMILCRDVSWKTINATRDYLKKSGYLD